MNKTNKENNTIFSYKKSKRAKKSKIPKVAKLLIILLTSLIILLVITIAVIENSKAKIELTQLSARSDNSMMGYFIKTKNNKTIVVDGGLKIEKDTLKQYIEKNGNTVDYWFITHPHKDHVGAFIDIVQNSDIEIKNVYYSINSLEWYDKYEHDRLGEIEEFKKTIENDKIKPIAKTPQIGEIIGIEKNLKVEILELANPEITNNAINNSSMVFKMYVNDQTILFLGDAGVEESQKLIKQYGTELKSDIVQMSHHGQNGATKELYQLVQPEICLWPTQGWLWDNNIGQGFNTAHYKTIQTREWMEQIGVKTNYVAKDGDITISIGGNSK